jgi:dihydroorotate dehydrogenase (fumarate)
MKELDLSVTIGGVKFEHPIMNGAGVCKDLDGVKELSSTASAAVILGSITSEFRSSNEGDVYYPEPRGRFALNSLGMPNKGTDYFCRTLPDMVKVARDKGKRLIVNVAGLNPDDFISLTQKVYACYPDLVELNFGCPNVFEKGVPERVMSFEPKLIDDVLSQIENNISYRRGYILTKFTPYGDHILLKEVAAIVSRYTCVAGVTTTNTFPRAFAFNHETGRDAISMRFAGLSGPAMLPIGLGQVAQFREALPDSIAVIGVGGITSGQDVADYLKVGATAVQITTALFNEGPAVFGRILQEYVDLIGGNQE